jgi:hypothetical protein
MDYSVDQHFRDRSPNVRETYDALLAVSRRFGRVVEEPKKTSIHLTARTAFAGVATRKTGLILTIKSPTDIQSSRISKHEQASANRWHLEIRLENASQVDGEIERWLEQAFAMSK